MSPAAPALRTLIETAETLAIALAGGASFTLVGFPAGLICGSVLAVATAALLRRPVRLPAPLARVGFVVIGIQLGAVITPDTVKSFAAWPASIAMVIVATFAIMLITATYLHRVHNWDRLSALLGASPGSMTQVIALSTELRGNLPAIAIVQTLRILLLTTGIPGGLALFGLVAPSIPLIRGAAGGSSITEMAIVVVVSGAAAFALWRLRFPAGLLFGAMAGSGVLHGTGRVHGVLPWWIGSAAILLLGALVGSRFATTTPRMLASYLGAAFGSFAVSALGRRRVCPDRGVRFFVPDRQRDGGVFAGGAGHDDGAFAGAAPRPDLCRGPSRRALYRDRFFGCHHRAADREG